MSEPVTNAGVRAAIDAATRGLDGMCDNDQFLLVLRGHADRADVSDGAVPFEAMAEIGRTLRLLTDDRGYRMCIDPAPVYLACGWERDGSVCGMDTFHRRVAADA